MPRRARVRHAGIAQHVIQRGNNRAACFFVEQNIGLRPPIFKVWTLTV